MKKALLIDDSRTWRAVLARWLSESGWQVIEAEDGQAGMAMAREHHPAVVVCDLMMPGANGFQVCRTIRRDREWNSQPKIIITTASGYEADKFAALEAGADEYFVKPIDHEKFDAFLSSIVPPATGGIPRGKALSSRPESGETRVRFWGVRGSIPTPGPETVFYGGNTSCVEVRSGGQIVILDAGTGLRPLGLALEQEFRDRPVELTVLITHTHWDHIQGFPFFMPAYNPKNKLCVMGYEGARRGLERTLSSQMESPYFPISMAQMPGHIAIEELKHMDFEIGSIPVSATFLHHPGICVGYRLTTPAGRIAYLTDHEPFQRLMEQSGKSSPEEIDYARAQDEALVEFISGCEIAIIDSQYDAEDYAQRVGWGHGCSEDVVTIGLRANVKRLYLFHHDPDHDDTRIARMVARAREIVSDHGGDMLVEAAREGTECVLPALTLLS